MSVHRIEGCVATECPLRLGYTRWGIYNNSPVSHSARYLDCIIQSSGFLLAFSQLLFDFCYPVILVTQLLLQILEFVRSLLLLSHQLATLLIPLGSLLHMLGMLRLLRCLQHFQLHRVALESQHLWHA